MSIQITPDFQGGIQPSRSNRYEAAEETGAVIEGQIKSSEHEEASAEVEILTMTDIEIRKIHALRRAKEYYEEQMTKLSSNDEKDESAVSGTLAGAMGRQAGEFSSVSVPPSVKEITGEEIVEKEESAVSYKRDAAVSRYKAYKKDAQNAWVSGDIDEIR